MVSGMTDHDICLHRFNPQSVEAVENLFFQLKVKLLAERAGLEARTKELEAAQLEAELPANEQVQTQLQQQLAEARRLGVVDEPRRPTQVQYPV